MRFYGAGFVGGFLGGAILAAIMFILQATGVAGEPGFVQSFHAIVGTLSPALDASVAAFLFAVAGGIWGAVYVLLTRRRTVASGILFGILPTLFLWLVSAPLSHMPLFLGFTAKGIILPLVFNCLIWGSFLGWYMSRRTMTV